MQPIRDTPWAVRIHILDLQCSWFKSAGPRLEKSVKFVKIGLLYPIFAKKSRFWSLNRQKNRVSAKPYPPRTPRYCSTSIPHCILDSEKKVAQKKKVAKNDSHENSYHREHQLKNDHAKKHTNGSTFS